MRIGYLNVKIFLEGLDITDIVSSYSIQFSKSGPGSIKLTTSSLSNIRELLPGTLVHIAFNDPSDLSDDSKKWFLFFEGTLTKKSFSRSSNQAFANLYFLGNSKIFDEYRYNRSGVQGGPIDSYTADILYVNVGLKAGQSTAIITNPADASLDILGMMNWTTYQKTNSTDPYGAFLKNFLEAMSINSPYIKVITESLRLLDQFYIHGNSKIYDLVLKIKGMETQRNQIVNNPNIQFYRTLLDQLMQLNMLHLIDVGVPSPITGTTKYLIIPTLEYTAPPIFNVLFPDEYNSYEFTIDFGNEITRAMVTSVDTDFAAGWTSSLKTVPTFLSPSDQLQLTPITSKSGQSSYYLKFTDEEKYRGVNAITLTTTAYELGYASLASPQVTGLEAIYGKEGLTKAAVDSTTGTDNVKNWKAIMEYISDYDYYKRRLKARGIGSIYTGYFNPNWMIGFPGFLITPEYGPVLVNFENIVLEGNASGFCRSTLNISSPRFISSTNDKEVISMDLVEPDWYDDDFRKDRIGLNFYKLFAKYTTKGASVIDIAKTKVPLTDYTGDKKQLIPDLTNDHSIEQSGITLNNSYYSGKPLIDLEHRKRKFVVLKDYFKFLYYGEDHTDINGFPAPYVTPYRKASEVDAVSIAVEAQKKKEDQNLKFLRCPFVLERAQAVAKWLNLTTAWLIYNIPAPPPNYAAVDLTPTPDKTTQKMNKYYAISPSTPTKAQQEAYSALLNNILNPLNSGIGSFNIISTIRSSSENQLVNGAQNSQHLFGEAADIVPTTMNIEKYFNLIYHDVKSNKLAVDQCILETFNDGSKHIHISYVTSPKTNRNQFLTATGMEVSPTYSTYTGTVGG